MPVAQAVEGAAARQELIASTIRCCRVTRTFKKEWARIEVGVTPIVNGKVSSGALAWDAIKKVLKDNGTLFKAGIAPKGNLERRVEQQMRKMGLKKDRTDDPHDW